MLRVCCVGVGGFGRAARFFALLGAGMTAGEVTGAATPGTPWTGDEFPGEADPKGGKVVEDRKGAAGGGLRRRERRDHGTARRQKGSWRDRAAVRRLRSGLVSPARQGRSEAASAAPWSTPATRASDRRRSVGPPGPGESPTRGVPLSGGSGARRPRPTTLGSSNGPEKGRGPAPHRPDPSQGVGSLAVVVFGAVVVLGRRLHLGCGLLGRGDPLALDVGQLVAPALHRSQERGGVPAAVAPRVLGLVAGVPPVEQERDGQMSAAAQLTGVRFATQPNGGVQAIIGFENT